MYDAPADGFLERYHDFMERPAPEQVEFTKDMFHLIAEDTDTEKITVIPARCGIGKSITVAALISYFCLDDAYLYREQNSVGLIVVTDNLERLSDYQNDPAHPKSIWSDGIKKSKIERFSTFISSDDSKTAMEQLVQSQYKPIVLLTTQRYFSMSDEQRDMLFEYYYDNMVIRQKLKREIVIFDEKPYFYETKQITSRCINDCLTALQEGIPECLENRTDKDWLLQEGRASRNRIERLLREKEKTEDGDRFFWKDVYSTNLTSNDEQFFELLNKHKATITKAFPNAITDFRSLKKLMTEGAFFTTQRKSAGQEYKTYFELIQDNRDKFYLGQNKAKFFVLDATSDIDPDYKVDYVNMIDCTKYNIPLNLKIYFMDVSTSKSKLVNRMDSLKHIEAIAEALNAQLHDAQSDRLLVTYKSIAGSFQSCSDDAGYFGKFRGTNKFIRYSNLAHVGNNRFADFTYFVKFLVQHPQVLKYLQTLDETKSRNFIRGATKLSKGKFDSGALHEIMCNSILVDFEQNIFRTSIRSFQNGNKVHIYVFWNCEMFERLNELIQQRYEQYGVEFEFMGVPPSIDRLNTECRKPKNNKATKPQKAIRYLESVHRFTAKELKTHLGFSSQDFRDVKRNPTVRNLLSRFAPVGKGVYEKVS